MSRFSESQPDIDQRVLEEVNKTGTFQLWLKPLRSVWSDGMKAIFGAKPSDKAPVGVDYYKLVHKKDIAYSKSQIALCLREGKTSFVHRVFIREKLHYLECHLWKEEHETACIKGVCRDITDQKLLEEKYRQLKKSEDLWKAALENAEQGVWDWDVERSTVFFSDVWKRMLGFEPEEISDSLEEWEKRVHPEDLAGAYANIQAHIDGKTPHYLHEHRLLNKQGKYIWILDSGKVIERKADGSPKRFIGTHTDITHLKKIEETAKRLALVAEKTQNAVIIADPQANILWVNRGFEVNTGYSAEEVYGRKPGSFLQGEKTNPLTVRAIRKAIQLRKPFSGEIYNYHKNGTGYWLSISITPILEGGELTGFIAVESDISRRKYMEKRLRRSEKMLRRAQETAKIGHWYFDVKNQKLEWSEETKRIHGVSVHYQPDVDCAIDFYHPDSREKILDAFKLVVTEGKTYDLDLQVIDVAGNIIDVRTQGRPEYDGDELIAVSGTFQDISERKAYEAALIKAKENAEAGNRAKQEFLAVMSHELRTPLNAVIGLTKLLLDENPREDQLENLQTIDAASRNLHLLIQDILDYEKILTGTIELVNTVFSPREIVQQQCNSINPGIKEKGLELQVVFADGLPEKLVGDAGRLGQILLHLLKNAVKFTESGEVIVRVSAKSQQEGCQLSVSVSDSGIGITPKDLERIFEPFTQARSDYARCADGSGLGLAMTRGFIELQGGTLTATSEVGKGSEFRVKIPYNVAPRAGKAGEGASQSNSEPDDNLKGLKVLLAEDNRVNVMVARKFLRKWKIEVDIAPNGIVALQKARETVFDLILMDLHMPEMGGIEATRRIRQLPESRHARVPIIALTASAMLETRKEAAEAGMDDYISKPFQPEELRRKIAAHVFRQDSESSMMPQG